VGRLVAGIFLLLALGGCASRTWVKPGASEREFARDKYDCIRESRVTHGVETRTDFVLYEACMGARDWSKSFSGPYKWLP
jgi:hypothetical protein